MKQLLTGLILTNLLFSAAYAAPGNQSYQSVKQPEISTNINNGKSLSEEASVQQNLIGEVTAVDAAGSKITVKTATVPAAVVAFNDKTAFRRIPPGQTSLANAEQITITDIKIGDRVLVPGGTVNEQTPVARIIVMAREAINSQRDQEREARRARTFNGRVSAINAQTKEIIIQSRGRGANAETITVAASGNVKFLRYAPDSLKVADAQAGSFNDVRVGDQIRTVGDRSPDGTRITAEEILSGSVTRTVGSILEVNAARGEIVVKNSQTGQPMTVFIGKNTTLGRIPADVAETLKQRANQRDERRRERANQPAANGSATSSQQAPGQNNERRNRRQNRSNGDSATAQQIPGNPGNQGVRQPLQNLPPITIAEVRKGDAILITTTGGDANSRMTAVSIVTGEAELQQFLQRTQGGGRNGSSPTNPGLPGNVGGGNSANDPDEPRN